MLVGTLLIGTLLNGMTIMDIQYTVQNGIKSVILLVAIVVDSIINPRDEQTRSRRHLTDPADTNRSGPTRRQFVTGGNT